MITALLLPIIVAAPAVAAFILLAIPSRWTGVTRGISLAGASVSLAGSIAVAYHYDRAAGGLQLTYDLPLIPSLGVHLNLAVDGWGVTLLLLTGVIIFAAVLASFTVQRRYKEFFIYLLVLVAGVFGVFVSQDLLVFFVFSLIAYVIVRIAEMKRDAHKPGA